jgi:hypothetical protein
MALFLRPLYNACLVKLFFLLTLVVTLLTCDKSSVVIQRWQVRVGRDTATWSNAFFCQKSDLQGMDTISEVFVHQPDAAYNLQGQIKILSRVPYGSLFIRSYVQYIKVVG